MISVREKAREEVKKGKVLFLEQKYEEAKMHMDTAIALNFKLAYAYKW